jgi:hypothetical protein
VKPARPSDSAIAEAFFGPFPDGIESWEWPNWVHDRAREIDSQRFEYWKARALSAEAKIESGATASDSADGLPPLVYSEMSG